MVHSAAKSPEHEYLVPSLFNRLLYSFLKVIRVLVPDLVQFHSSCFVESFNLRPEAVEIAHNITNISPMPERSVVETIGAAISQDYIVSALQSLIKPLLVELVVDDHYRINARVDDLKLLKITDYPIFFFVDDLA